MVVQINRLDTGRIYPESSWERINVYYNRASSFHVACPFSLHMTCHVSPPSTFWGPPPDKTPRAAQDTSPAGPPPGPWPCSTVCPRCTWRVRGCQCLVPRPVLQLRQSRTFLMNPEHARGSIHEVEVALISCLKP